jgi:hypothetical protein
MIELVNLKAANPTQSAHLERSVRALAGELVSLARLWNLKICLVISQNARQNR